MDLEKFIERTTPLRTLGVKVSQNGEIAAEHCWEGEWRRNIYSASKSITALAVGLAMEEGRLSLEEKLVDAFAKDLPERVDSHLEQATVRDLLTMCLGQADAALMGTQRPRYEEDDWVKMSLAIPFVHEPGSHFVYSNVGPYLAGILVQRRVQCDLPTYLAPRLFEPLGIRHTTWEADPFGNTFGAGGLFLTLTELHKLGELCLREGEWNGKQLIPREWIRESVRKQVENGCFGYGYLFWRGEHASYRMDGKFGQLSIVIPDKNAVISTAAECREEDLLRRVIFEEIYPQL